VIRQFTRRHPPADIGILDDDGNFIPMVTRDQSLDSHGIARKSWIESVSGSAVCLSPAKRAYSYQDDESDPKTRIIQLCDPIHRPLLRRECDVEFNLTVDDNEDRIYFLLSKDRKRSPLARRILGFLQQIGLAEDPFTPIDEEFDIGQMVGAGECPPELKFPR
jgi:hypothetical protein